MDAYFVTVLDWTLPIKKIIEKGPGYRFRNLTAEDRLQLWSALTTKLPRYANDLELIYMPLLKDTVSLTKSELD